jgi:nucleoside-diphosphate-sugar epimerase
MNAIYADMTILADLEGFQPKTNIEEEIRSFTDWNKENYKAPDQF